MNALCLDGPCNGLYADFDNPPAGYYQDFWPNVEGYKVENPPHPKRKAGDGEPVLMYDATYLTLAEYSDEQRDLAFFHHASTGGDVRFKRAGGLELL